MVCSCYFLWIIFIETNFNAGYNITQTHKNRNDKQKQTTTQQSPRHTHLTSLFPRLLRVEVRNPTSIASKRTITGNQVSRCDMNFVFPNLAILLHRLHDKTDKISCDRTRPESVGPSTNLHLLSKRFTRCQRHQSSKASQKCIFNLEHDDRGTCHFEKEFFSCQFSPLRYDE